MSAPKWPQGPYYFLEAGNTEMPGNAGRPLTICSDVDDTDLANVYSADDASVNTPREQAVALAHLFAAAPDLYERLSRLVDNVETGSYESTGQAIQEARAALAKARGKSP